MTGQTNARSAVTVTRRPQPGAAVGLAVAVLAVGDPNRTKRRSVLGVWRKPPEKVFRASAAQPSSG